MFCIQTGNTGLDLAVNILIFIAGTAVLVKGSDLFIDSAANIARRWGVSELVIGLTLVSIGTSLPELASSTYASIRGEGSFIIGNIVGSNVTNISLILAIGIIGMGKMPFEKRVLTRDAMIMIFVSVLCGLLFLLPLPMASGNGPAHGINYLGAILLLVLCVLYMALLFRESRTQPEAEAEKPGGNPGRSIVLELILLAVSGAMVMLGSKGMVDPVVWGAQKLGVSMLVISATIVAFGTSVPELAVTLAGIIKNRHEIALGNILGSNIFNILLIFGVTGCISPLPLDGQFIGCFNVILMEVTAGALLLFMIAGKDHLKRAHGFALLVLYVLFMAANCAAALMR